VALAVVRRSVPVDAVLAVDDETGAVPAAQEIIVTAAGESASRPPARGPLTPGLRPHTLL
jgi:hypothetical protein